MDLLEITATFGEHLFAQTISDSVITKSVLVIFCYTLLGIAKINAQHALPNEHLWIFKRGIHLGDQSELSLF